MVSLQGLRNAWQVLNELLGELKTRGVFIPDLTYADLRQSKMVIEYLSGFEADIKASDAHDERLREEMESKIISLRDTLTIWAEKEEGIEYRKQWEKRVKDALEERLEPQVDETPVPISDLPRDKEVAFFRIKLPDEIPVEVISELAEDCGVLISLDGERHLQVSGEKDCVRDAMKRLGELFYGESKIK